MTTKDIKKDPSEYSVEEKLQSLFQLQTMLTEIDKIKTSCLLRFRTLRMRLPVLPHVLRKPVPMLLK